jgi:hypothetical protein
MFTNLAIDRGPHIVPTFAFFFDATLNFSHTHGAEEHVQHGVLAKTWLVLGKF